VKLPVSARLVIGLWATSGLIILGLAIEHLGVTGWPGSTTIVIASVFGLLMAGYWVWPLVLYLDEESDGVNLDEGFFVVLALLVPAAVTVLIFAVVAIVAQAIRRRPLAKSIFNTGQMLTSSGTGLLVFGLLHQAQAPMGYARVGAALAGAVTYFVVNGIAMATILKTLGSPFRTTILGSFDGKILVVLGSILLAVPTAILVARQPEYLPAAVFPLLVLRYLGAGTFYARHDRARLRGLFEATLEVNRSMGNEDATAAILDAARSLLRSPSATLTEEEPASTSFSAPVDLGDRRLWLAVSGRSRTEPFDEPDRALLDALASVGAVALTNTELYEEVQRQKDHLSLITNSLGEGVCAVNAAGEVTFMNPAGAAMLGWTTPPVGPALIADRADVAPTHFLVDPATRAILAGRNITTYDTRFQRADGTYFPVTMTASPVLGEREPSGAVIVFRDTSERKEFEEQLARHAFQDALTGLANRRLLLDHLDHALLRAERSGEQIAVLFCDIDRFKFVNDNLGHQAGDEFLRSIADRLRGAVRPGDTLSRFGGDEFIVLLEGVQSLDIPHVVAQRVLQALRDPLSLSGGHEVVATMSIGIAISEVGKSRDDLLHDADVAMYRAKDRGRGGQFAVFDVNAMGERSIGRVDLESALHQAVERGEIVVHYQPLISLSDRRVVGAEALVRWDHPEDGLLLPDRFIQLAEDTGAILPIGQAVLERACRQAHEWHENRGVTVEVGVNLSARQFQQVGLAEAVAEVLHSTGINPAQLCLEITESLAMDDVELTSTILFKLHTLGVRLAIDDFGTGHSSLGYLSSFPIDVVKIDQSFVSGIEHDPVKSAIVSAVVSLSKAIGSTTVVEGVETVAQLDHVRNLGCDVAQGFYFARPMSAEAFGELAVPTVGTRPELHVVRGAGMAG
jgi:diguanylate cyclase (GGDEF)-like protein/PAS domain S-box-containing protein